MMHRSKADENARSAETPAADAPRGEETGRKGTPVPSMTQNMRRKAGDSSSSCDNEGETFGEKLTKRRCLDASSAFCEEKLGTPGRQSSKQQRAEDSLSSSEGNEGESDDDSLKGHRQSDSSSSCEEREESGGEQQAQINISKRQQSRWDSMFARLIAFKEKHDHCLVPNRFLEDRSLGAWVSTQRRHYKLMVSTDPDPTSTPLTNERIQKLNDVGFVWATSDPRHTPWDVRFNELRAYREQFGNALVPIGYTKNIQLSNWVSTQRQGYRAFHEGRPTRMTQERIDLLESIGMVWDAQRGGNRQRGRIRPMAYTTPAAESALNVQEKNNQRSSGDASLQRSIPDGGSSQTTDGFRTQEGSLETFPSAFPVGVGTSGSGSLARFVTSPSTARPFLRTELYRPEAFSIANNNRLWTPDTIGSAMSQSIRFGNGTLDPAGFGATASPPAILQALTGIRRDSHMIAQEIMNTNAFNDGLRNLAASAARPFGSHAPASTLNGTNQLLAYRQLQSMAEQSHLLNRADTPLGFGFDSRHDNLSRLILARYGLSDPASLHPGTDTSRVHSLLNNFDSAGLLGLNNGGHHALGANLNLSQYRHARMVAAGGIGSLGISSRETALRDIIMNTRDAAGREPTTRYLENQTEDEEGNTTGSHMGSDGK